MEKLKLINKVNKIKNRTLFMNAIDINFYLFKTATLIIDSSSTEPE